MILSYCFKKLMGSPLTSARIFWGASTASSIPTRVLKLNLTKLTRSSRGPSARERSLSSTAYSVLRRERAFSTKAAKSAGVLHIPWEDSIMVFTSSPGASGISFSEPSIISAISFFRRCPEISITFSRLERIRAGSMISIRLVVSTVKTRLSGISPSIRFKKVFVSLSAGEPPEGLLLGARASPSSKNTTEGAIILETS